jgi:hypothetical protein
MEGGDKMTPERMKELNRKWRKACMPIYIQAFIVLMLIITIMVITAIIGAIITGELPL